MASVPFAFNAQQVAGLTVEDSTSGIASTSATLKIGNATTPITVDLGANNLQFVTSGTTTLTLPSGTGTVCTTLSCLVTDQYWNQSSGSLFANNSTEDFLFGSQASISATFHLFGSNALAGTQPVASIGAKTSFATMVIDQSGLGDIFTASAAGKTIFTLQRNGNILDTLAGSINFGSAALTVGSCTGCGTVSGGTNYWNLVNGLGVAGGGYITPINSTADLLIGGQSTASAVFAFTGLSSTIHQTQASFSGQFILMPNNGYGGNLGIGYSNLGTATLAVNGNVGIGTTVPIGLLNVSGAPAGQALVNFNYTGTDQNIFTASSSGVTKLTLDTFGNLNVTGIVSENGSALLVDPMQAPGDIIFRGGLGSDVAPSGTATGQNLSAGVATNVNDSNDSTYAGLPWNYANTTWVQIDLGSQLTISGYRIVITQESTDQHKFSYSTNGSSWTDVYFASGKPADSGVVTFSPSPITARYWRITKTDSGGTQMNIATIQLFGPSLTTRLAIGSTGQVLTVSGGVPTWQAPATNFWQELTGALSPTQTAMIY